VVSLQFKDAANKVIIEIGRGKHGEWSKFNLKKGEEIIGINT